MARRPPSEFVPPGDQIAQRSRAGGTTTRIRGAPDLPLLPVPGLAKHRKPMKKANIASAAGRIRLSTKEWALARGFDWIFSSG
jgi:hypothetical protein